MKRLFLLFFLSAFLSLEAKETIKIGVVLPLTGNMAQIGEMGKMGLQMRLKELGDKGKFTYQIIFEDDEFVFSRTAMAVKKLREIDHADVIMTMWGYGSDIALPYLADKPDVLHLNIDRWTEGRGKNDFVCGAALNDYIKKMMAFLKAKRCRNVIFIGTSEQGTEAYRRKLAAELAKNNLQLLESTMLSAEVRDLRTWILRAKEKNPDLIIEGLEVPAAQILMQQMHDLGFQFPMMHTSEGIFEVEQPLQENAPMIYPSPPKGKWLKDFQCEYKRAGVYPAPQFYNTISLLVDACERLDGTRKPNTAELAASMKAVGSFEGSTGTLYFSPPNKYEAPVSYFVFKNGEPVETSLAELIRLENKN